MAKKLLYENWRLCTLCTQEWDVLMSVCSDFNVPVVCIKSVCYTPVGLTTFCHSLWYDRRFGSYNAMLTKYHNLLRSGCPSKSLVSCQVFVFVLGLCHFTSCYIFSCLSLVHCFQCFFPVFHFLIWFSCVLFPKCFHSTFITFCVYMVVVLHLNTSSI